jgi:hypothetical protein
LFVIAVEIVVLIRYGEELIPRVRELVADYDAASRASVKIG